MAVFIPEGGDYPKSEVPLVGLHSGRGSTRAINGERELMRVHKLAVLYHGRILRFYLVQLLDVVDHLHDPASILQPDRRTAHHSFPFPRTQGPPRFWTDLRADLVIAGLHDGFDERVSSSRQSVCFWRSHGSRGRDILRERGPKGRGSGCLRCVDHARRFG